MCIRDSICIVHTRERSKIREIEKVIGKEFVKGEMPSGKEICAKQLYKVIDDIERVEVDEEEIASFIGSAEAAADEKAEKGSQN